MIEINSRLGKTALMLGMLLIAGGYFWGINSVFPSEDTVETEASSNEQLADLAIEFSCTVWVEEVFPILGQDIIVSVASYFDNMAPMGGVDGEVILVFPDGEKALFYLPTSDENGLSSVSVSLTSELEDNDTGRVLVYIYLHTFEKECETETSFYVWP